MDSESVLWTFKNTTEGEKERERGALLAKCPSINFIGISKTHTCKQTETELYTVMHFHMPLR